MDHSQRGNDGVGDTNTHIIGDVRERGHPHFQDNLTLFGCFDNERGIAGLGRHQDNVKVVELVGERHLGKVKLASHIVMEMSDEFCGVAERKGVVLGVWNGLR